MILWFLRSAGCDGLARATRHARELAHGAECSLLSAKVVQTSARELAHGAECSLLSAKVVQTSARELAHDAERSLPCAKVCNCRDKPGPCRRLRARTLYIFNAREARRGGSRPPTERKNGMRRPAASRPRSGTGERGGAKRAARGTGKGGRKRLLGIRRLLHWV